MAAATPPAALLQRYGNAPIFVLSVVLMAMKPMLLHLTRGGAAEPLPPAVFQLAAEGLKVAICAAVLLGRRAAGLRATLWCGWTHTLAFALPAAVYLLMNVLTVVAGRILPPPTFQLVANLKILCTAVASWMLLSKRIANAQWIALALLTAGVTLGQWQGGGSMGAPLEGVLLMVLNSCLSAGGGVLTERLLKAKQSAELSIFATNVHMAVHTFLINGAALLLWGGVSSAQVRPRLPDAWDMVALTNEALNGIFISLLMRRIDTIAKNYAFSISVFVTAGISAPVLGYRPAPQFFLGAGLTLVSIGLYARGAPATSKKVA